MIVVVEQDVREHGGRRFNWRPAWFAGRWGPGRTWRLAWGLWSLSYYPSPGLRDFFDDVEQGEATWYEP